MARNNGLNFNLPSVDDLFSTEESRAEARLEKVVNLNPSEISDFPDHPFKVRDGCGHAGNGGERQAVRRVGSCTGTPQARRRL